MDCRGQCIHLTHGQRLRSAGEAEKKAEQKGIRDHTAALDEVLCHLDASFPGDIRASMQAVGHRCAPRLSDFYCMIIEFVSMLFRIKLRKHTFVCLYITYNNRNQNSEHEFFGELASL